MLSSHSPIVGHELHLFTGMVTAHVEGQSKEALGDCRISRMVPLALLFAKVPLATVTVIRPALIVRAAP